MTTKTIANRPKKKTRGNKCDIYRWVARGKTRLVAIHVFWDGQYRAAYIQNYIRSTQGGKDVWVKDEGQDPLRCTLQVIPQDQIEIENPGGGYESATLKDDGGNVAGWLLITTGGNAHGKGNMKARLKNGQVKSKKFNRVNRREYHTLIYREKQPSGAPTTLDRLSQDQKNKYSKLLEELDSATDVGDKLKVLYAWHAAAYCDEPPSDVLLEEEEYEVEAVDADSDLLQDIYFPDEYEYDYEYDADPESEELAP